jgi:hypothetical protein
MARKKAAKRSRPKGTNANNGANLGFEATLWAAWLAVRGRVVLDPFGMASLPTPLERPYES